MNNWPMKLHYSDAYRKRGVISLFGYSQVDIQKGRNVAPSMLGKLGRKQHAEFEECDEDLEEFDEFDEFDEDWGYDDDYDDDDDDDDEEEDYL